MSNPLNHDVEVAAPGTTVFGWWAARRMFLVAVAIMAVFLLVCLPVTPAEAVDNGDDDLPDISAITTTELPNGDMQVIVNGETYVVQVSNGGDIAVVTTQSRAQVVTDSFLASHGGNDFGDPTDTQRVTRSMDAAPAASGLSCTYLMWIVTTIHGGGWAAIIGILLASGPAGAAALAIIYALGASGFLAWVSAQC